MEGRLKGDSVNHDDFELLRSIFKDTATVVGDEFLQTMVRGLGTLMQAETTFVARALDSTQSRVRVLAAWKDGAHKESWDYDLAGNPCQLTYDGQPTLITCDIAKQFPNKKDSGYQSYIGIPLKDADGRVIGHIAIYASKIRAADEFSLELAHLCGLRAEAEVRRMIEDDFLKNELERLRIANSKSNELLSLASHDLRAPLSSVIGTLSALQQGLFGELSKDADSFVTSSNEVLQKLMQMTNDVLDEQRVSHGEGLGNAEKVKLEDIVNDAIQPLQMLADRSGISFEISILETGVSIEGERSMLTRMFGNVLSNAIKYSPENGKITVRSERMSDKILVSIVDQGPGVAEAHREMIFEPFKKGPQSLTGVRPGAGLGLSLAQKIAVAHNGCIRCEAAPNGGGHFVIELSAP